MSNNGRARRQSRALAMEITFDRYAKTVPVRARPGLLAVLRRYQRHRARVFWLIHPTGRTRRL
jgi:hypothetical protein